MAITDANGAILEKRLFDAWGSIAQVQDGNNNILNVLTILDRGYTGHEHLQSVGLIDMNARLYDPKLHRFLQPDNYVQDPSNTQNYNRYGYCWNNPLRYTDASGEWINIVIGAIIGGVVNWATHGCQFNAQGLGYFAVGAVAGALTAMGAGGVSSALAGGSFSAGALGTAAAYSVGSGFVSGAVVGAAGGLVGGFATGFGNSLVENKNIGDCFKNGIHDGALGAITGGVVGGVAGGIKALSGDANFWTGNKTLDLSEAGGFHNLNLGPDGKLPPNTIGKYMGKFEGVNVYESDAGFLGSGEGSGGLTLPPNRITVGKGAYSLLGKNLYVNDLFRHEFGHILEYRQPFVGLINFYKVIGTESLLTSNMSFADSYWTETWANHLSNNYFGGVFNDFTKYPAAPLSFFNFCKFFW